MIGPTKTAQPALVRSGNHSVARPSRGALPLRALVAAAVLSLLLGAAISRRVVSERSSVLPAARAGLAPHMGITSLPLAARAPVSGVLGADDPAYWVRASSGGFQAVSQAQRLHVSFGRSGVLVASGELRSGLSLYAVGYGNSLRGVGGVRPSSKTNRVTYQRAELSEWYINGPLGLEQGFTIPKAPSGHPAGPLTLAITLTGDAHAVLAAGGKSLMLSHIGGSSLRYGGLLAIDTRGHKLHSWLELSAGQVRLRVDTRGASYPLRIDPLIQQGRKLNGEEVNGRQDEFGSNVALSSDGNTALIGAQATTDAPVRHGCSRARARPGPSRAQSSPAAARPADGRDSARAWRCPPTATPP